MIEEVMQARKGGEKLLKNCRGKKEIVYIGLFTSH
jgi:hypothetical protein